MKTGSILLLMILIPLLLPKEAMAQPLPDDISITVALSEQTPDDGIPQPGEVLVCRVNFSCLTTRLTNASNNSISWPYTLYDGLFFSVTCNPPGFSSPLAAPWNGPSGTTASTCCINYTTVSGARQHCSTLGSVECRVAPAFDDWGEDQPPLRPRHIIAGWDKPFPEPAVQYLLDEASGKVAKDETGCADGTLKGNPKWLPDHGYVDGAIELDGQGDYVKAPHKPCIDITDELTIAFWYFHFPKGGCAKGAVVEKVGAYAALVKEANLAMESSSHVIFRLRDDAGKIYDLESKKAVKNLEWHHVAMTTNGKTMKIYIDGKLDAKMAAPASIRSTANDLYLGRRDAAPRDYAGKLDHVTIYRDALGPTFIKRLYNDGIAAHMGTSVYALEESARLDFATAEMDAASADLPVDFALTGAYPNPFNPSTTITFTVPEAADVTVGVFDMLGRQVQTLASGLIEAGTHEVTFEAGNLPSGIYLVRMDTPQGQYVRKITLLK